MATVRIYIRKRPAKDGKFPISICITINRKQEYILTGQKLDNLDQWDEKTQRVRKSHPNSTRLNNFLLNELAKANDKALEMETKGIASAKEVKISLKPVEEQPVYFIEVANQYLEEQRLCGNYEVYKTDAGRLKRFYDYANGGKITFPEINVGFLHGFLIFLKQAKKKTYRTDAPAKPLSERTITNHIILIRTIYNRAITTKRASNDNYPFGANGKISISFPTSKKIGLEQSEVEKIENLNLSAHPSFLNDARNIWLMEFYFAGMRITDCLLLKWTDFQNGRLFYTMSKNGEPGSVKVPEKAIRILDQYRDSETDPANKHGLVFSLLQDLDSLDDRYELRRKVAFSVKRLNTGMEKIMVMIGSTKNASQHKARHTFAQRAEDKNVHPKVLQKMYRHESILTTMNYQSNFSHQKADEALDAVVGF
jgi:integrase